MPTASRSCDYFGGRSSPTSHAVIDGSSSGSIWSHSKHRSAPGPLPLTDITSTFMPPQCSHRPDELDSPMLQFDAAPVVTSILFCVSGKEFLSRNREVLGDMRDRGREASPMRRRSRRGTLHLPNWEGATGPRWTANRFAFGRHSDQASLLVRRRLMKTEAGPGGVSGAPTQP
jgi:hypothetical protein